MAISTKNFFSIDEVPNEWIFEYYLGLEKLTGQDIRMRSVFNPGGDKKPSMSIFVKEDFGGSYRFKDFSTGYGGNGVDLIFRMEQMRDKDVSYKFVKDKIIAEYKMFIAGRTYERAKIKVQDKYKVVGFKLREWNTRDARFWLQFKIDSDILNFYQVKPLESYTMSRKEDEGTKELVMSGSFIYGYFRLDGTLYKIYQPKNDDTKFLKVKTYIQGTDQLTYQKPYLIIISSLKDMMSFKKLNIGGIELVAPDSENTLIPKNIIASYKHKYKGICTLMDNDTAGIKSMGEYQKEFGIPAIKLELSKDPSDSIRDYGLSRVRNEIFPLLKKTLKG